MAFGMAGNLFHLSHNFLTHKCPSLSRKRHLFKHTEIYGPSEMIAYAPQDIFQSLSAPVRIVSDIIDKFDISAIEATYKGDGTSSSHPRMLLKVVVCSEVAVG